MTIYYTLGQEAAALKLGFVGYAKSTGLGAAVGGVGGYLAAPEDAKGTGVALGALGGGALGGASKHLINKNVIAKGLQAKDELKHMQGRAVRQEHAKYVDLRDHLDNLWTENAKRRAMYDAHLENKPDNVNIRSELNNFWDAQTKQKTPTIAAPNMSMDTYNKMDDLHRAGLDMLAYQTDRAHKAVDVQRQGILDMDLANQARHKEHDQAIAKRLKKMF